jgi:hypothetical protein
MKTLLLIPTTLLTIASVLLVLILGTSLAPQPALAATTYTYRSSAHPYNYVFNMRGQIRHVTTNDELRSYLEDLINYIQQIHDSIPADSSYSNDNTSLGDTNVSTLSASNVSRNSATLHGDITDFRGFNAATVWFEFGKNSRSLSNTSDAVRINRNSNTNFELPLSGLISNTTYYFQAVASDSNGTTVRGDILHFTTNGSGGSSSNNGNVPDVTTRSATSISTHEATLRGYVDMNDFNNGRVFFVYGQDESAIADVPSDFTSYSDVNETDNDLQKVSLDSNLDGTATYDELVSGLSRDTEHFYRLCVEYQDDNNDDTLECGSVMNFTTDN